VPGKYRFLFLSYRLKSWPPCLMLEFGIERRDEVLCLKSNHGFVNISSLLDAHSYFFDISMTQNPDERVECYARLESSGLVGFYRGVGTGTVLLPGGVFRAGLVDALPPLEIPKPLLFSCEAMAP